VKRGGARTLQYFARTLIKKLTFAGLPNGLMS
jgi:hypothetical protein